MTSTALIKKEMRESLPAFLIVTLVFAGVSVLLLRIIAQHSPPYYSFITQALRNGRSVGAHALFHRYESPDIGIWLICLSIILGVSLGIIHFWIPQFTKTWAFLLHRSTSQAVILMTKFLTAALIFI
jgi:hypothetical protein